MADCVRGRARGRCFRSGAGIESKQFLK
jgi:hypothetical protein